jgi:hypothetical protein
LAQAHPFAPLLAAPKKPKDKNFGHVLHPSSSISKQSVNQIISVHFHKEQFPVGVATTHQGFDGFTLSGSFSYTP